MVYHKYGIRKLFSIDRQPATPRSRRLVSCLVPALLLSIMVAGCSKPPTTNKIETLTLQEMDRLLNDPSYTGFIAFMASWCPPCKEELPILADLHTEFREKGIKITAVSVDAGAKDAQPLIDRLGIQFPVYWVGADAITKYGIAGVPTLMVINKGTLIEKLPGARSRNSLEKMLLALVANR